MAKLMEDELGDQHMMALLHTIHKDVIESVILNTIGYKKETDPEFEKKLYSLDECAGSYVISFTVYGTGKGLTGNELGRTREAMAR
jgi:hypothetical protein